MSAKAWGALLALLNVSTAHAQEKTRAWAEQSYASAKVHIEQGRYDAALSELMDAYEVVPAPALLFNIAQCHRAMEDCEQAIRYYEQFLAQAKNPADRKAAEDQIADCKSRQGKPRAIDLFGPDEVIRVIEPDFGAVAAAPPKQEAAVVETPKVAETPKLEETRKVEEVAVEETPAIEPAAVPKTSPDLGASLVVEEVEPPLYERWWFWTAIGGAVAIIVGGTVIGVTAKDEVVLPSGSAGTIDLR